MNRTLVGVFLFAFAVLGCGDDDGGSDAVGCGGSGTCSAEPELIIGGDRPAEVTLPADYDPDSTYPLVVQLHGFGADGPLQRLYFFGDLQVVTDLQFILVAPNGTINPDGNRFWNGTPACCDGFGSGVDDVGYLRSLIEEAMQTYNISSKRVYLIGHSNGGYMSFRMACEASDVITAIASLAGSTFLTEAECAPQTFPVSVLAIHGTADATVPYEGRPGRHPSAPETVERHAAAAGCDIESPRTDPNLDLDLSVDGAETEVVAYETGCARGVDAALWTIRDGVHIPFPIPDLVPSAVEWMLGHSR